VWLSLLFQTPLQLFLVSCRALGCLFVPLCQYVIRPEVYVTWLLGHVWIAFSLTFVRCMEKFLILLKFLSQSWCGSQHCYSQIGQMYMAKSLFYYVTKSVLRAELVLRGVMFVFWFSDRFYIFFTCCSFHGYNPTTIHLTLLETLYCWQEAQDIEQVLKVLGLVQNRAVSLLVLQ
jgi:hypothetical protein